MIYALKQCGTSRPSTLVRRTDLPNARFPARLDSAESDTTPCGAVVGEKATQNGDAARLVVPRKCKRCRRRKRPRCAHTADVAQAALDIGYSENQSVLDRLMHSVH